MKRLFLVFLLLGLSSCDSESKEEAIPLNASKIVGSWQIVSESYSTGGPQISVAVENGAIYDFALDGTFIFKKSDDTLIFSGTFSYDDEVLRINYSVEGEAVYWDLKTSFEDGLLTWYPIGPSICIEGCSTTLKKIK